MQYENQQGGAAGLSLENPFALTNPMLIALHREADTIQQKMLRPERLEDPAAVLAQLSELSVLLPRLGEMKTVSQSFRDYEKNRFLSDNAERFAQMKATEISRAVNIRMYEYDITYDRMSQMYTSLDRRIRDLVSEMSYLKAQMQNNI